MSEIKKLGKHTLIYGLGGIISKTGAFILLPLYTNYLSVGEYGVLELLYMTSSIVTLFLGRQIAHATLRFYYEYDGEREKNSVISTSFLAYTTVAIVILTILSLNASYFSRYLFSDLEYIQHFYVVFIGLYFNLSKEIFLAYVRALEKAFFYVIVSIAELILKVIICIWLVAYLDMGVLGVLLGNLCGDIIAWCILFCVTFKNCGFNFASDKIAEIFKYAFPLMLVGISGSVISNADKFFLKNYSTVEAVGLYGLAMRFASILRFLVVNPFTRAYGPFRFSIMKQDNARQIYSRVATYFIFICVWACLIIAAFTSEIIMLMADKAYWEASSVVPILLVSVLSGSGLYYIFQTGVYVQKSTKVLSYVFLTAAIVDIFLMIMLIPKYGLLGAAISQAVVHVFIAILGLYFSNRVYVIEYNWKEIITIKVVGLIYVLATFFVYTQNPLYSLLIKIPIVLSFPVFIILFGVFTSDEKRKIYTFLQCHKNKIFHKGTI